MIGGATSAMGDDRQTTGGAVDFATGVGLNVVVPAAFTTASTLKVAHGVAIDVNIAGVNISAMDTAVAGGSLTINENASLGSSSDTAVAGNTTAINMVAGKTLKFTGTGGLGIGDNTYTGVGDFDFSGGGSTLEINSHNAGVITLDSDFINADKGTLNVNTNLALTHLNSATIANINVAAGRELSFNINDDFKAAAGAAWRFGDADSTIVFKVAHNDDKTITFNANLVGGADNKGRLEFHSSKNAGVDDNTLTITGGKTLGTSNVERLKEIVLSGDKKIKFDDVDIFAKKITINSNGEIKFDHALDSGEASLMKFTEDKGIVILMEDSAIEKIDFNGKANAELYIADDKTLTIGGGSGNAVEMNGGAGASETVDFTKLELNNQIKFDGDDSKLKVQSLAGNQVVLTLTDDLDPGAGAGVGSGIIEFHANGNDGAGVPVKSNLTIKVDNPAVPKTLGAAINLLKELNVTGDATVTLNHGVQVFSNALNVANAHFIVKDASIAAIKEIAINNATGNLEIDGTDVVDNNGGVGLAGNATIKMLEDVASKITFGDAASRLTLSNNSANNNSLTFTFYNHLVSAGNNGVLVLNNTGAENLIIDANGGAKTLGTAGNTLKELRITGNKAVTATNLIDLTNIEVLNVSGGAVFVAQNNSVAAIPIINIGSNNGVVAGGNVGAQVAGTLTLDATADNVTILNGSIINFNAADSVLRLTHSDAGDKTFTLHANLAPTAGILNGDTGVGIVEIHSNGAGRKLIVTPNGVETLGTGLANRLKELRFTGAEATGFCSKH